VESNVLQTMNLIYIANARIPTEKAHGGAIVKLCEAFATSGVQVTLVVPKRKNVLTDNPYLYYGVKENFAITYLPTVDTVEWGKFGFLLQNFTFACSSLAYLLRYSKKGDVMYGRDVLSLFLASFARSVWFEMHENRMSLLVRSILRRAKGLVVTNNALKDLFSSYNASLPILVARNAIDASLLTHNMLQKELRARYSLPEQAKIVGYVGKYRTMGRTKGVLELMKAVAHISKDVPEVVLLLVGIEKGAQAEVYEEAGKIGLQKYQLHIVGHVPQTKVIEYVRACDVVAMNFPAKGHYTKYMSPLKMFEYMVSGVPIVSSNLPSITEVLSEKNSFLFEEGDQNALQNALHIAIAHADSAQNRAQKAYEDAKKYTWDRRAKSIRDFITGTI
jgi:glycosyltransferase involved in cell wall biosynthesis